MRARDAAVVATRIIALFLMITAVILFVTTLPRLGDTDSSFWLTVLTQAGIAAALWLGGEAVGEAMARGTSNETAAAARPVAEVLGIAFSVVGLYLTVQAVPELVSIAATDEGPFGFSPSPFSFGFATTAGSVTKLFLGLILLIGGPPIASALAGFRAPGAPASPPGAPPPPPG